MRQWNICRNLNSLIKSVIAKQGLTTLVFLTRSIFVHISSTLVITSFAKRYILLHFIIINPWAIRISEAVSVLLGVLSLVLTQSFKKLEPFLFIQLCHSLICLAKLGIIDLTLHDSCLFQMPLREEVAELTKLKLIDHIQI